jgi:hypothetical protein
MMYRAGLANREVVMSHWIIVGLFALVFLGLLMHARIVARVKALKIADFVSALDVTKAEGNASTHLPFPR